MWFPVKMEILMENTRSIPKKAAGGERGLLGAPAGCPLHHTGEEGSGARFEVAAVKYCKSNTTHRIFNKSTKSFEGKCG